MITNTYLGSHTFNGPLTDNSQLAKLSGVYMITTLNQAGQHMVLDVGESHNVHQRVSTHDRTQQWRNNATQGLYAWVHYCDEKTRMALESALRSTYRPVCGYR